MRAACRTCDAEKSGAATPSNWHTPGGQPACSAAARGKNKANDQLACLNRIRHICMAREAKQARWILLGGKKARLYMER
jgi:hypothetical protein